MPFNTEQFFNVFRTYNQSVYPAQIILLTLGLICVFILHIKKTVVTEYIGALLVVLWLWTGIIYHITFFTSINKAAYVFGVLFILQGIFFLIEFVIKNKIIFDSGKKIFNAIGYFLIVFGLIIYPVIGFIMGKEIYLSISFGLPCPSVIFTFGIIILASKSIPKYLFIIPSIWAIIGFFAAIKFNVYQDVFLPISALTAIVLYFINKK